MNSPQPSINLALSGGGFRAALFHLGVVRFLREAGLLRNGSIGSVASVSGGSILTAHIGLNWKLYTGSDKEFNVAALEFINFIRGDIRGKVVRRWIFAWITLVPRLLKPKRWTFTNLLQDYYRKLFMGARLRDLTESASAGAPNAFFNCASLGTGSACTFGNSKFFWADKKGVETSIDAPNTRVDFAVAASSAFPPLFPPIAISSEVLFCDKDDFRNPFYLTDGGIYDNLGIDRLFNALKEQTSFFIVSDAEGNFPSEFDKRYSFLISRNVRASNFLMTRVSTLKIRELEDQPIVWIKIKDEIKDSNGPSFLPKELQRKMCDIRTDLDEFLPEEITALIAHGYAKARDALMSAGKVPPDAPLFSWDPLGNWHLFNDSAKFEYVAGKLDDASRRRWRLWSTRDWVTWATSFALMTYFFLAIAALPASLIALARAFPTVLPFWAPFDASIAIRDVRVANVSLLAARADSTVPAAQIQLEFVQVKTGPSTLKECVSELRLKDVFKPQPDDPEAIEEEAQAVVQRTFFVPKDQYANEGSLRMVCARRVTDWSAFQLPRTAGINTPTVKTFLVCMGEFQQACGSGVAWAPCGSDAAIWAKSTHPAECVNVGNITKLSDVGGNRCGYATFQVTCSSSN
jgi:predicted acylesterase/phospholipase RssA